jgi:hypothetical protein
LLTSIKPYLVAAAAVAALTQPARADSTHTAAQGRSAVTVFLDGGGAVLRPGYDDGAAGRSSLVASRGLDRLEVPAFAGGADAWDAIVGCVRSGYADFAVDLVDRRPSGGDYITIVIGGRPGMLGYGSSVSGMAPYSGDVIDGAVAFVFSDLMGRRVRPICEAVMHELGHTLGLDHSRQCKDVMSYQQCGPKQLTDLVAACGEGRDRDCGHGEATQSSRGRLARTVGLRGAAPAPANQPADDDGYDDGYDDDRSDDDRSGDDWPDDDWYDDDGYDDDGSGDAWLPPPAIELTAVAVRGSRSDRIVRLTAAARATAGIAEIELAWATPDRVYLFRCSEMPADVPVSCRRRGGVAVFTLRVGAGPRGFALRVVDAAGQSSFTEPQLLSRRGLRR